MIRFVVAAPSRHGPGMSRLIGAMLALGMSLGLLASAQAQQPTIDVTFGPPTVIPQGGSGFVPVFINSTAPTTINTTGFQFLLSPFMGRMAQFQNSPPPGSDPTFSNPNYVFFNNSADQFFNARLGTASTTTNPNDTIVGGDSTKPPFTDITLGTTPVLLGDLPVTAGTGVAGDTFAVNLVPTSGTSFTTAPGNTGFTNQAGTLFPFAQIAPGEVIIGPAVITGIPEPSTMVIGLLGGLAGLPTLLRRWKRAPLPASAV